jgi:hypothetical protein
MRQVLRPTLVSRALLLVAAIAVVAGAVRALASCLIADPPAQLPAPVRHRPIIDGPSAVPPQPLITTWPPTFNVPVEMLDPSASFSWRLYGDGQTLAKGVSSPQDASPRLVSFVALAPAGEAGECHTIQFSASLFVEGTIPPDPALVDPSLTDSIFWSFDPGGDFGGCPLIDAGVGDAFPDITPESPTPVVDGPTE